jgi:hypothetical protein
MADEGGVKGWPWAAIVIVPALGLGLGVLTWLALEAKGINYVPPNGRLSIAAAERSIQEGASTDVFLCAHDSLGKPLGKRPKDEGVAGRASVPSVADAGAGGRPLPGQTELRGGEVIAQLYSPTGGRFADVKHICVSEEQECKKCIPYQAKDPYAADYKEECKDTAKDRQGTDRWTEADWQRCCEENCSNARDDCKAKTVEDEGRTTKTVRFDGTTDCQTLWFSQDNEGSAEIIAQSGLHRDRITIVITQDSSKVTKNASDKE